MWSTLCCIYLISTRSGSYHLNIHHVFVEASASRQLHGLRQTSLTMPSTGSVTAADKLTDICTKQIVRECIVINFVDEKRFSEVLKATLDSFYLQYKAPPRTTKKTQLIQRYKLNHITHLD